MVVTEADTYSAIVGNDWLSKANANIDYRTSIITLEWNNKKIQVPVEYRLMPSEKSEHREEKIDEDEDDDDETSEEEDEDEEEYEEEELEEKVYNYCEFIQKKNHYNETIPNIMNVLPEVQPKEANPILLMPRACEINPQAYLDQPMSRSIIRLCYTPKDTY